MKAHINHDNALTQRAQRWKKDQGIKSLTLDEMLKKAKGGDVFVDQKVDGQSAIMSYKGGHVRFASLDGRLMEDFPLANELADKLKSRIDQALVMGEMAGYENGKILSFNETQSLIKAADADKDKIHWFPYQILEINGRKFDNDLESYIKSRDQLDTLFEGLKHVHPTKHYHDIEKAWKQLVEKEDNEGLVVRMNDGIFKVKPVYSYDLVVIAFGDKKLKNWKKGLIGNALVAFMDKDRVFRVAGEVGTGWTEEERRELFEWAQKNKVDEDDQYIWVKPERIMEIQWERSHIKPGDTYTYKAGQYEEMPEKRLVGTIVKPRFIRWREDKSVNPRDLRLTQIPDWEEEHSIRKEADYPDHPNDVVIKKSEHMLGKEDITELDVWSYYEGIKSEIIPQLKGHDLFIVVIPNSKPVYIRHPYDKKTEFIRINNAEDFEVYHSGRTVEYHVTMPSEVPYYIIDMDVPDDAFDTAKTLAGEVADKLGALDRVQSVEIRYTGKRGFHILGHLKKPQNVDAARVYLEGWLEEKFGDMDDVVLKESPSGQKIALGLSPMKLNGGHVALHSLRVSGLCCMEVPRSKVASFRKEEATLEKTFKKLTGNTFAPMQKKEASYDRDKLSAGYQGRFVIQSHDAQKAGKHWDLRLEFPVESLQESLGHYEGKRLPHREEPVDDYPDDQGSVYRSFVVKKRELPTKDNKVFLVETEDHPMAYGTWEGTIPEGQYGAGEVSIWDKGTFEILDAEYDHKYVLKFDGKKLSGTYALVKYKDGFLWVKANAKTASALDYPRPILSPQVWDNQQLRELIREDILGKLIGTLEEADLHRPFRWLKNMWLTGSICTYTYNERSDVDVNVRFDGGLMRQLYPELRQLSDRDIRDYLKKILYVHNKKPVGDTTHPLSFVILTEEDLDSDAIYDLIEKRWIKPPPRVPVTFDPDRAFIREREAAVTIARIIEEQVGRIVRIIYDLKRVDLWAAHYPRSQAAQVKRVMYHDLLRKHCIILDRMHTKLRDIWHHRFHHPRSKLHYPAYDFSTNWESYNLMFKYLQKWKYHRPVALLYDRLEGDPYLDLIDTFIPD